MGVSKARGGLGFKDSHVINVALLAKQCWRVLQDPSSLVSKVFKHKYYPKHEFLQAKMGYCPSYTWISLLASRVVLQAGLIWRIGDGKNIKIWKDPWIDKLLSNKIQSPLRILSVDALVSDLIDEHNTC